MTAATTENGPDTVLEHSAPTQRASARLQQRYLLALLCAGLALLTLLAALGGYAYQRQYRALQAQSNAEGVRLQRTMQMRLDALRQHVGAMRYAMERGLRWPTLADGGFVDRIQQRNLAPLRDAWWERLPVELARELGSLQLDPNAALDSGTLRRDLNAASAMLGGTIAMHNTHALLQSSYYLDGAQRWRLVYPPQSREERLRASGSADMGAALHALWPDKAMDPMALARSALQAQRPSAWSAPFATPKGMAVSLLAPVMHGNETIGIVGSDIALEWVEQTLVQMAPTLGRAVLTTAAGVVLADSGGAVARSPKPLQLAELVAQAPSATGTGATASDWLRLTLPGSDWTLWAHQDPATLRSATLRALLPYFALTSLVALALGLWAWWSYRHFTLPAAQLVQYGQQLEYNPQHIAPPAPAFWAPWFTQLAQGSRERQTLLRATMEHARAQQKACDVLKASLEQQQSALAQQQAANEARHAALVQQQAAATERQAALELQARALLRQSLQERPSTHPETPDSARPMPVASTAPAVAPTWPPAPKASEAEPQALIAPWLV